MTNEPTLVQPSPLPHSFQIGSGEIEKPDGTKQQVMVLTLLSAVGTHVVFLIPGEARHLAGMIISEVDKAEAAAPIAVVGPEALNGLKNLSQHKRRKLGLG